MSIDYTPREGFLEMSVRNIAYSFFGLLMGIVINQLGKHIYQRLNITSLNVKIVGQIVLCSIAVAFFHTKINSQIAWEWQNDTPGMFFTAFLFGVQYISFTSIQEVYGTLQL